MDIKNNILFIVGVAIASAASFMIFNIIKYLYLRLRFGFKPNDHRIILVILFAGIVYGINMMLPKLDFFLYDILYLSFTMTEIYVFLILISKVSDDNNVSYYAILQKLKMK